MSIILSFTFKNIDCQSGGEATPSTGCLFRVSVFEAGQSITADQLGPRWVATRLSESLGTLATACLSVTPTHPSNRARLITEISALDTFISVYAHSMNIKAASPTTFDHQCYSSRRQLGDFSYTT